MASLFRLDEFPPPSATVQVTVGAQSRRGRSRLVNEDHYLVMRLSRHQETLLTSLPERTIAARFEEYGYVLVVADGTGAAGDGEAASHLAIATLLYLVRHFGRWNLRVDDDIARDIMARAERFYRHIDSTVKHVQDSAEHRPYRTTLTATFGAGNELFFAHVGHSRAYLLRDGRLMRLTRDHTLGARPASVAAPLRTLNTARRDLEHFFTGMIGMPGSVGPRIDIERFELCDGDRVLVCTNGLTDAVDDASIASYLSTGESPDDQCRALADLALSRGTLDDATALVAWYRLSG
jgi:serine/threonine protein phosphatase PrpC